MFIFQVSFIVPPTAIPGRLGLLLTLFLCMVNTLNSVSRYSPKADSGPTMLIIWIVICICFQLCAILEYAWVIATQLNDKKVAKVGVTTRKSKPSKIFVNNLDKFMRVAFPITFIAFATIFWISVWKYDRYFRHWKHFQSHCVSKGWKKVKAQAHENTLLHDDYKCFLSFSSRVLT